MDANRHEQICELERSRVEGIGLGGPVSRFLRLIRFSHTIFALPFALGALIVAANGWPSLRILLLVLVCMVFARTGAMLFNRLVDWSLDQRNPRTASRHLLISKFAASLLLVLSSAGFVLAAAAINRLTFVLAPVALLVIFFYSVTKRFTSATHFFLGLALAVAPVGGGIRSDLCHAGLRVRPARRYSFAGCKAWSYAQPSSGAAITSCRLCCADRLWSRGATWSALLLVDASDCSGAGLRTQNRETRSRRNQSRVFSKQCICERGISARGLRGSIDEIGAIDL